MQNTSGIHLKSRLSWLRDLVELVSSMRFAISLLVVIAIASVIGTVLKQNEPMVNYVNQFGVFWFEIFNALALNSVYNASWFLVVMAFLVLSTTLCIVRNAPKMLHEMRTFREQIRIQSLRAFPQHTEWQTRQSVAALQTQIEPLLKRLGYRLRIAQHPNGVLLAAKAGVTNRLGYLFAHGAIVMICIGGLLDSDIPVKLQAWWGDKQPLRQAMRLSEVPPQAKLSAHNPTFRANVLIPEGRSTDWASVNYQDGTLLQPLPFSIELKKFVVDYYSTGMPKLFASEVLVTDKETGKQFPATIKVNEPLRYKGIAVYQSSFDDGGSEVVLEGLPWLGTEFYRFEVKGEIGTDLPLAGAGQKYTLELTSFRATNVENVAPNALEMESAEGGAGQTKFREHVATVLSPTAGAKQRQLRNVGPSVQYKLRDATGQAREYHNYLLPIQIGGTNGQPATSYFVYGVRDNPNDGFRYLRVPLDMQGGVEEFMRLRLAFANTSLRALAAENFAQQAQTGLRDGAAKPLLTQQQLSDSAQKLLATFSSAQRAAQPTAGYEAVAQFITKNIAPQEQENAARLLLKMLTESAWELWQQARTEAKLPVLPRTEENLRWLQAGLTAVSDSYLYEAPVLLQLKSFTEVKASVLQMTRSPGKNMVYLGSLLLVLGIFAMFYIRERRVWIAIQADAEMAGGNRIVMAMTSPRKTLDFQQQFDRLVAQVRTVTKTVNTNVA